MVRLKIPMNQIIVTVKRMIGIMMLESECNDWANDE